MASVTLTFRPLRAGPMVWRSSGRHLAEAFHLLGDRALLADGANAHRFKAASSRQPLQWRPRISVSSVFKSLICLIFCFIGDVGVLGFKTKPAWHGFADAGSEYINIFLLRKRVLI